MLVEIFAKSGGAGHLVSMDNISLDAPSIVRIQLDRSSVKTMERVGNDLMLTLHDGTTMRIANFYTEGQEFCSNDLVLQEQDGSSWLAQPGETVDFVELTDWNDALACASAAEASGGALLLPLLGLLGAGGLVAVAAGGGGSDKPNPSIPDTTPPAAPTARLLVDSGSSTTDKVTNDGRVQAENLENGAKVQYQVNEGDWIDAPGGLFDLPEGTHADVKVRQVDAAGNIGPAFDLGTIVVDKTAPGLVDVSLRSDSGELNDDQITNDAVLNISEIEDGATVEYLNEAGVWTEVAVIDGTITIPDGSYEPLQVRQVDVAGNEGAPTELGDVIIDTIAPAALEAELAEDTGISDSDGITNNGQIDVTGADPEATVQYLSTAGVWTDAVLDEDGSFIAPEGVYTDFQVRQVDAAGNVGEVESLGPITIDTTPPAAIGAEFAEPVEDGITNDAVVNLTAEDIEDGATVEYLNEAGVWTEVEVMDGTITIPDGSYEPLQIRQVDVAGNEGAPTGLGDVIIDTMAPAALEAELAEDTGASDSDGITNNGQIDVTGADPEATVQYLSTAGVWTDAVLDEDGSFTAAEGVYTDFQVRQVDAAGNASEVESLGPITIDTTPPAAIGAEFAEPVEDGITNDAVVNVPAEDIEDGATVEYLNEAGVWTEVAVMDGTITIPDGSYDPLQVRQVDVAGNTGDPTGLGTVIIDTMAPAALEAELAEDTGISDSDGITNNGQIDLTGVDPDATVQYLSEADVWTDAVLDEDGSFTAAEGVYTDFQVRQVDAAGNASEVESLGPITIDTTPPAAIGAEFAEPVEDGITNDAVVNLTVEDIEDGATVEYLNEAGVWTEVAVTGGTITIPDGTYDPLQVRQVDVAGNAGDPTALGAVIIDTIAPAALEAELAEDTGASDSDGITNNGQIDVTGADPEATVQYLSTADVWTDVVLDEDGSFIAPEGVYTDFQVRQVDAAGNASTIESLGPITIDTTPPGLLTASLANDDGVSGDGITTDNRINVLGAEPGATVEYRNGSAGPWTAVTLSDEGSFILPDGSYTNLEVRQTDIAGNIGAESSVLPATIIIDASLQAALAEDTGISDSDGITSNGKINVTGNDPGTTIEYRADGDTEWTEVALVDGGFVLPEGEYVDLEVRQVDSEGVQEDLAFVGNVIVDTTDPAAPDIELELDSGASNLDFITNNGTVLVTGLDAGATAEYRVGEGPWTTITDGSFTLAAGEHENIEVRQTDVAGNVGASQVIETLIVDTVALAPVAALVADTGTVGDDGVTTNGTVEVTEFEPGATLEYRVGEGEWTLITGGSFTLPLGANADVEVRQTDVAGNVSPSAPLGTIQVVTPIDAVDDQASLDMGAVSAETGLPQVTSGVTVLALLESDDGYDAGVLVTVGGDRSGSLRVEVQQTALLAVGDAFRLDIYNAAGEIVYSAVTENSLLGDVAGLPVLGVLGDDGLVANVTGLPPGDYYVVVSNDQGALDEIVQDLTLEDLGEGGAVLGAENQAVILDALDEALGGNVLSGAAVAAVEVLLNGLNGTPLPAVLTAVGTTLTTVGLGGLVDGLLDTISAALLSNALTILQQTTITTTLTEYDFADESIDGNVITGDEGAGADDVGAGAQVTSITNSDGDTAAVVAGVATQIAGQYGVLTISASGDYSYQAYGDPASIGQSESFTYEISSLGDSDSALLVINISGAAVGADSDTAEASVEWEYATREINQTSGNLGLLGGSGFNSAEFEVTAGTIVSGVANITGALGVLQSGYLMIEQKIGETWVEVPDTRQSFSYFLSVLSNLASVDLSEADLAPGTYRITGVSTSLASLSTLSVDIDLLYEDRFNQVDSAPATGNIFANDAVGSPDTVLTIKASADAAYTEVDGVEVIAGLFGTLTINPDGSYSYAVRDDLEFSAVTQTDSFDYVLTHPNGEMAQAQLDITITPSGDGVPVVEVFAMNDLSALLDNFLGAEEVAANDNSEVAAPPAPIEMMDPIDLMLQDDTIYMSVV